MDDVALCASKLRKNERRWVLRETTTMPDSIWHGEWCGHLITLDPNSSTNWMRTQLCRDVEAYLRNGPTPEAERDDTINKGVK